MNGNSKVLITILGTFLFVVTISFIYNESKFETSEYVKTIDILENKIEKTKDNISDHSTTTKIANQLNTTTSLLVSNFENDEIGIGFNYPTSFGALTLDRQRGQMHKGQNLVFLPDEPIYNSYGFETDDGTMFRIFIHGKNFSAPTEGIKTICNSPSSECITKINANGVTYKFQKEFLSFGGDQDDMSGWEVDLDFGTLIVLISNPKKYNETLNEFLLYEEIIDSLYLLK